VNVLAHVSEQTKHLADAGAAVIAIGTLAQVLPSIAALLTIVWLAIRIVESQTFSAIIFRVTGWDLVAWRATPSSIKKNTTGQTESES
jgi:hypothetical protein